MGIEGVQRAWRDVEGCRGMEGSCRVQRGHGGGMEGTEGVKGGQRGHRGAQRGMWMGAEGGTEGCGEGHGEVQRDTVGVEGCIGGMEGCGSRYREHGGVQSAEGFGGAWRGACPWLPQATIELVDDNRKFEV